MGEDESEIRLLELEEGDPELEELEAGLCAPCGPGRELWTQQFAASGKSWAA